MISRKDKFQGVDATVITHKTEKTRNALGDLVRNKRRELGLTSANLADRLKVLGNPG